MVCLIITKVPISKVIPFGIEVACLKHLAFSDNKKYRCETPGVIVTSDLRYANEMAGKYTTFIIFLCISNPLNIRNYLNLLKAEYLNIKLGELNLISELNEDNSIQISPVTIQQREIIILAYDFINKITKILTQRSYIKDLKRINKLSNYSIPKKYGIIKKEYN